MELVNMDPEVTHFVDTMLCTDISSPVTGQIALDLMVNPPRPGDPSYDTYTQVTRLQGLFVLTQYYHFPIWQMYMYTVGPSYVL